MTARPVSFLLPLNRGARKPAAPRLTSDDPVTRKLPARWGQFLFSLLLSGLMSLIVTLIATLRAFGFTDAVLYNWLTAWPAAWIVAFPALFVLAPIVRRIVAQLVEKPGG